MSSLPIKRDGIQAAREGFTEDFTLCKQNISMEKHVSGPASGCFSQWAGLWWLDLGVQICESVGWSASTHFRKPREQKRIVRRLSFTPDILLTSVSLVLCCSCSLGSGVCLHLSHGSQQVGNWHRTEEQETGALFQGAGERVSTLWWWKVSSACHKQSCRVTMSADHLDENGWIWKYKPSLTW